MKKNFHRKSLSCAIIACIVAVIAFALTHRMQVFLRMLRSFRPPGFFDPIPVALHASLCVLAIAVLICIVYILVRRLGKHVLAGFLILTIMINTTWMLAAFGVRELNRHSYRRETERMIQRQAEMLEERKSRLAPIVWTIFPEAEFSIIELTTFVELHGYSFWEMPDMEEEMETWRQLQSEIRRSHPESISICYHFEGNPRRFASIILNSRIWAGEPKLFFSSYGMDSEVLDYYAGLLREHLSSHYDDFYIENWGWCLSVRIYETITREEMPAHEEIWQDFIYTHDINTELVTFDIIYRHHDTWVGSRKYDLQRSSWASTDYRETWTTLVTKAADRLKVPTL
jgi:hypothetical protein